MRLLTACVTPARSVASGGDDDLNALQQRVSAEFGDMPALILTLPQAARLFSIESARCERVLRALVNRGVLSTDGHSFWRTEAGVRCA